MSQCRKCGMPLEWVRREFGGIWKWVPTNPDGSDHWDLCREQQTKNLSPEELAQRRINDAKLCPPFWSIPDGNGSFRTVRKRPANFGVQPEGELF